MVFVIEEEFSISPLLWFKKMSALVQRQLGDFDLKKDHPKDNISSMYTSPVVSFGELLSIDIRISVIRDKSVPLYCERGMI